MLSWFHEVVQGGELVWGILDYSSVCSNLLYLFEKETTKKQYSLFVLTRCGQICGWCFYTFASANAEGLLSFFVTVSNEEEVLLVHAAMGSPRDHGGFPGLFATCLMLLAADPVCDKWQWPSGSGAAGCRVGWIYLSRVRQVGCTSPSPFCSMLCVGSWTNIRKQTSSLGRALGLPIPSS